MSWREINGFSEESRDEFILSNLIIVLIVFRLLIQVSVAS
jgi:hypothetical protein